MAITQESGRVTGECAANDGDEIRFDERLDIFLGIFRF